MTGPAIAANSLTFAVARFVGPALAGPVIAVFGVEPAILANSVGYLVSGLSLLLLRVAKSERRGHAGKSGVWTEVVDGVRYAARHAGLGPLLLYSAATAMLLRGVQEILPPFVERIFGLGAESLAILTACFGVGALVAGLWVAARGKLEGSTRLAVWSGLAQAVATAGFVATGWFPLGMLCAALIGGFASVQGITVQTLLQAASDPVFRGRMLSLWGLITRACPALGALVLGGAGELFGLRLPTLAAVAVFMAAFAYGMWRLKRMEAALEDDPEAAARG
jgi:hypothetical protein